MNTSIDQTINLYQKVGWKKFFSAWRFMVAPYEIVEKYIPKSGSIVELGCGEGIFSNYLGISSKKRKIKAYEISNERIREATRGVDNVKFIKSDVTRLKIPKSKIIVLFHLLHHLRNFNDQEKLIANCYKSLVKGGKLVIVEIDIKFSLKYFIAWTFDHFIVPMVFERKIYSDVYFRKKSDWLVLLKKNNFKVKCFSAEEKMPFSHIIFTAVK